MIEKPDGHVGGHKGFGPKTVETHAHIIVGARFVDFMGCKSLCAKYAQIFFPGSASLGNLGSAAGIPWIAPGVSERISWTAQAIESSLSVGRAQEDSTQRGGPWKAAEEAKPIGGGVVSNGFT